MKRIKLLLPFALVLVMALTGCNSRSSSSGASGKSGNVMPRNPLDRQAVGAAMGEVTLNIRVMNEIRNTDSIINEYYKRVANDPILSKVRLNINFVTGGDYRDKANMLLNTQDEDIDLMFLGAWHGLTDYAKAGLLADLTDYFSNNAFPGLRAGFSDDYINAAKTFVQLEDGSYDARLYSIPLAEAFNDMRGINYREDLRVKYRIPEITNDDIFEQYLRTVLANEEAITYGWDMYNGFFYAFSPWYQAPHHNVFPLEVIGQEAPIYVALNNDATRVLGAVVMGDTQENFNRMPDGYRYDFFKEYHLGRLRWVPYLSPTRGTTDGALGFAAGAYAVVSTTITDRNNLATDAQVLALWPDASIRLYITEQDQRNQVPGAIVSEMKSNNFLVVPEWSQNQVATMYFLDWMFGSRANHDLFQFGIEGYHWEAVGSTAYRLLNVGEENRYIMPGYSFTWNPNYVRYLEEVINDPELKSMFDYQNSLQSYTISPISGFAFNNANVTTQVANVTALSNELMLRFAIYGNTTERVIDQWYRDAVAVGLNDIKSELVNQLQAFIDIKRAAGN
jgi:putative aldouronate transport system substrate-binding protein